MIKKYLGLFGCLAPLASCTHDKNDKNDAYDRESRHNVPIKYNAKVFNKFAENTNALDDSDFLESNNGDSASKVFYFGFDKSDVDFNNKQKIAQLTDYLIEHPDWKIKIDGHTDERGSREYNIALGERRAKAVSDILVARGVKGTQMALVSYGKERPVTQGHDENSWQKNRRAELDFNVG